MRVGDKVRYLGKGLSRSNPYPNVRTFGTVVEVRNIRRGICVSWLEAPPQWYSPHSLQLLDADARRKR